MTTKRRTETIRRRSESTALRCSRVRGVQQPCLESRTVTKELKRRKEGVMCCKWLKEATAIMGSRRWRWKHISFFFFWGKCVAVSLPSYQPEKPNALAFLHTFFFRLWKTVVKLNRLHTKLLFSFLSLLFLFFSSLFFFKCEINTQALRSSFVFFCISVVSLLLIYYRFFLSPYLSPFTPVNLYSKPFIFFWSVFSSYLFLNRSLQSKQRA